MFRSKAKWVIRSGMIGKLVPRLCDPNGDVVYRALEATRNMLSVGGNILCDAFMKADILTVLEKVYVEFTTLDVLRKMCGKETLPRLSLRAVLSVFGLLAEQNDVAVCRITKCVATRKSILICIGARTDLPVVAEFAAQLLHIISDNNPIFTQQIRTSDPKELKALIQEKIKTEASAQTRGSAMRTRLHIAGMFFNTLQSNDMFRNVLLRLILDCVQISPLSCLNAAIKTDESGVLAAESSKRQEFSEISRVQMTALEIFANMFSDDDEVVIAPEIQYQLIDAVISLIRILGAGKVWSSFPSQIFIELHSLRFRALTCLSNMIHRVRTGYLCKSESDVKHLFDYLFRLCVSCSEETSFASYVSSEQRGEAVTSELLWSLLRREDAKSIVFNDEQMKQIRVMIRSESTRVRLHTCGMISTMCSRVESNKGASVSVATILCVALEDMDMLVVSEALNGVFDLFGETTRNDVFEMLGFMERLSSLLPILIRKFRSEGSHMEDVDVARVDEALENLQRFLDYKRA